jgi:predicted phosphate transport protein (TIGR00153 family)
LSEKGSLLEWFGKRRESVVMKGMREHAQKITDTITELNRAVVAMTRGEKERALDAIKRVALSEKEADGLESMITEELSKGDLESREREDLMHLIRRMDYVADWAKEASLNLQLVVEANVQVPVTLWVKYSDMTAELEKSAKALKTTIDNLGVDEEAVEKYERSVIIQEHILDEMYFSTKKEIFFADIDPKAIYLMRDILHGIENSADKCKDAADIIHILVIAQRHKAR